VNFNVEDTTGTDECGKRTFEVVSSMGTTPNDLLANSLLSIVFK